MQDLKYRTKSLSLRIIKFYTALPQTTEAQVIGKQLLRSGTSVGAHYRKAIRARSNAEFTSKIDGGLQELEESAYWLELLADTHIINFERLTPLLLEIEEPISIFSTLSKDLKLTS